MKKSIILHIQLKFTRLTIFFVFTVTSSYTLMLKKGNSKLGTYCISFPFFRFLDTKVRKFQILTYYSQPSVVIRGFDYPRISNFVQNLLFVDISINYPQIYPFRIVKRASKGPKNPK